jgi:heme/copper-type cytochrome/quinol oxidase subunit 2
MRKTIAVVAVFLYISMLILTANAQTPDSSNANPQSGSTLIGEIIAIVGVVAIFAVIAYAGYKVIKKWSSS